MHYSLVYFKKNFFYISFPLEASNHKDRPQTRVIWNSSSRFQIHEGEGQRGGEGPVGTDDNNNSSHL